MKDSSPSRTPTKSQALIFRGKTALLQARRGITNLFDSSLKKTTKFNNSSNGFVIGESQTPLWTESDPNEQFLIAGKIENLRLVAKNLNGLEIPANQVFSFWQQVGRASRLRGFVVGRELREGCIIPTIGGGLCQISNALYDAALQAQFEIVERHAHTQVIKGSLAESGHDATVFWNYVDLRFRSDTAFRIEATIGKSHLSVKFKSDSKKTSLIQIEKNKEVENGRVEKTAPNSCATCGVESCFRSLEVKPKTDFGKTAYLVDEFSTEFDNYVQETRSKKDLLFVPLDGKRFRKANYAWSKNGFAKTKQSLFTTAVRSYKSRKLSSQGAERQKNLLAMHEKLAAGYAKQLNYDVLHLVIQQNLLPFLWSSGALGGRTFDVLMNSLPISEIQKRLDYAYSLHPESKTLADFRADKYLIKAEKEALKDAEKIITPHREVASLFPDKVFLLDWHIPKKQKRVKPNNKKFTIVFPASTVGRKGCYELREALNGLDIKLLKLGGEIEGDNFWAGFDTEKADSQWDEKANLIVLPAFIEHKPRRLLHAIEKGIPVIATNSCGLGESDGVETIRAGDSVNLKVKIEKFMLV